MEEYFIGRQPIFNRRLDTFGYELLYRSCEINQAQIKNGDQATTQVILNAYAEIGLGKLVGSAKAFINVTENFINGIFPTPFQPDRLVLEIPETIEVNETTIVAIKKLHDQGYQIALDDVIDHSIIRFLDITDYVKVDLVQTPRNDLVALCQAIKKYPVKLVAEKVETQKDLDECLDLGFDYFQGYFLCKPRVTKVRTVPPNRAVIMHLLAEITHPNITFSQLETVLSRDVSLGYKLLQLVNSAYYGLDTRVKSMQHAIALLGSEQLRRWLMLFLLADTDDKPRELIMIAIVRARMCQMLAQAVGRQKPEEYFMIGLFSVLDALYDIP
ncbi:MAG: HDOD domain-containing protein, partial [Anaerolineaceae bacterium]|nr:HDOD domain-containing protein [Anaerolineaceae bacterium]